MEKKTLIIWQSDSNKIRAFLIPEHHQWLENVHNQAYTPGNTSEHMAKVVDALTPDKRFCINPDDELASLWAQYEIDYQTNMNYPGYDLEVIMFGTY